MRGPTDKLQRAAAIDSLNRALDRAEEKHDHFPDDPHHQLCLMAEELGEAARALNDMRAIREVCRRVQPPVPHDERDAAVEVKLAEYRKELEDLGAAVFRALAQAAGRD